MLSLTDFHILIGFLRPKIHYLLRLANVHVCFNIKTKQDAFYWLVNMTYAFISLKHTCYRYIQVHIHAYYSYNSISN